jgi:hypothetical protein
VEDIETAIMAGAIAWMITEWLFAAVNVGKK